MAAAGKTKHAMTNWYNPVVLVKTAIRVAISTVFGEFADRREAIAAANAIAPQPFDESFDYSSTKGDFWFDFLADTGDGWNSTYAMARLASQPEIQLPNTPVLPRGRFLMLGGDEVYPFASRKAYDERFLAPFDQAQQAVGLATGQQALFALPGNHDWYDGLSSFFGLFCRRRMIPEGGLGFSRPGRIIAGRATNQTRSYFALKLPANWWIWGTDSQLEGYIDQPQIDFFQHAAREWMEPGSKLILCVDGPRWFYAEPDNPEAEFENFSYLERLAGAATDATGKSMGHELKLVLTGDSHHYSRFIEEDRQYITCGGGGAFLHPTHHLRDHSFAWRYPPPGTAYDPSLSYRRDFSLARKRSGAEALFPDRVRSRLLTFWNLLFAFINWRFTATLAGVYTLFQWLLDFNSWLALHVPLGNALSAGTFADALRTYWKLAIISPAAFIMLLVGFAGYYYAADAQTWWRRLLMGGLHAVAQAAVVSAAVCWVMRLLPNSGSLVQIITAGVVAAFFSATTYGIYLLISLLGSSVFGGRLHWNEAFSSFAHRGYKCFLRMKIATNGELTIYPVGLTRVPFDRRKTPRNPKLEPHLIEDPLTIAP